MTRRLNRRRFLALTAATTGLGLLKVCAPAATPSSTAAAKAAEAATPAGPKTGGTFTLARTSGVIAFNPVHMNVGHFSYQHALWNTLLHYDANLNPVPELAEKWDFSADGKVMTLKLRQGVKFHSGREFTAEDAKFAIQFGQENERSTMRPLYQTVKQIEVVDRYTIALKGDSVNPGLFDLLDVTYIADKELIKDMAKTAGGTGPFRLDKYLPNDRVEMVANRDYWEKGKPYLDRFVLRQIPDAATLAINLESGAVDAIWDPTLRDMLRLKEAGAKYVVDIGAPGNQVYNLAINTKHEVLKNKKVRQAMAWSIDRARFCKTSLQGLVQPTCLMWPIHSWAHFKDLEGKIGYNLDNAKALLKEAGQEKGFEVELLCSSKMGSAHIEIAQILQADLKKINVNARVADLEQAQYDRRTAKGDIQLMIHTYARSNRDPGTLVTAAKAWYNEKEGGWTHFESPAYDSLRVEMQSTLDQEKRKATARKIQEMMLDECFTNPIAENPRPWAMANYVKGLTYNMDNAPYVGDIWLDR